MPTGLVGGDSFGVSEIIVKDPKGTISYKSTLVFSVLTSFTFKLDNISLATPNTTFNVGDKIPFNINYSPTLKQDYYKYGMPPLTDAEKAEKADNIYITLKNKTSKIETSLKVEKESNGSNYVILAGSKINGQYNELVSGEYSLYRVELISSSRHINSSFGPSVGQQDYPLNFNFTIKVINKNNVTPLPTPTAPTPNSSTTLSAISLKSTVAKKNEKVSVNLSSNLKLKSVMMSFSNASKTKTMIVYLKGINSQPYFTVPYTTEKDDYSLAYMILTDTSGKKYSFSKDNSGYEEGITKFNFNSNIKIEDAQLPVGKDNKVELDNDKITKDIITEIKNINNNMIMTIDATSNPIIQADIFAAIKGTNKTIIIKYNDNEWIFNGNDIKEPKNIDVSVNAVQLNESGNSNLNTMLKKGLVISFQKNGELPGKALIRLKSNSTMAGYLGKEKGYVYYYDENGKKLDKVAMEISLSDDGYYEFYINHNSTYILTTEKPEDTYVSDNNTDLQLNAVSKENAINGEAVVEDNSKYLNIIIIMGTTVIILLIIIAAFIISRMKELKKYK